MGLKDCCRGIAPLATAKKMVFNWGSNTTHISNVVKTPDLRIDVHRDFENPGMAIAYLQVNKDAKDPGAKVFLRKGNTGSGHKTTHKVLAAIRFSQVDFNETTLQAQLTEAYKYTNTVADLPDHDNAGEGSSSQAAASSAGSEEWYYLKEEGLSYRIVNGNTEFRVNPPVKVNSDWIWSSTYTRYFIKKADGSVEWQ